MNATLRYVSVKLCSIGLPPFSYRGTQLTAAIAACAILFANLGKQEWMMTQYAARSEGIVRLLKWLTPLLLAYGFFRSGSVTGALTTRAAKTR